MIYRIGLVPARHQHEFLILLLLETVGFPVGSVVKNLPALQEMQKMWVRIPGLGRSPGEEMATHFSILAWEILWTEEPGRPQSMQSQRVGHN